MGEWLVDTEKGCGGDQIDRGGGQKREEPRLHARGAVERRVEGGVDTQLAAVSHMHDAPVLPGARAVKHGDGAAHVGRVGDADAVA